MKVTLLLFTLSLLLLANSCKKSVEKQLPPATQTGANTFGCLINGKPYTATEEYPKGMSGPTTGTVYYALNLSEPGLLIDVTPWEKDSPIGIRISVPEFKGVGMYRDGQFLFNMTPVNLNTNSYVHITKYENGIVSGTFQAKVSYENKTYSITHGRFDLKK